MKDNLALFIRHTLKMRKLAKIVYFGLPLYTRNEVLPRLTKNYIFRHEAVLNYLKTRYKDIIDKYKNDPNLTVPAQNIPADCPYWVFWYQGEKQMPDIVKACVASLRRHAGKHPVHVLDKDNFTDFVHFSDTIMRKVKDKQMTLIHFSDLLRNRLLTQHGGIWFDSTLYLTGEFCQQAFTLPYFTLKAHPTRLQTFFIGNSCWTGFCQGGVNLIL